jgi:hypothetical protein
MEGSIMRTMISGLGVAAIALLGASVSHAGETVRAQTMPCGAGGGACSALIGEPADRPPGALPGQCYAKVRSAPRFETYTVPVVVTPPRRESRVIPAIYESYDERVLVSPEHVEHEIIPATFRSVRETIVVQAGGQHVIENPPIYDTVVDTVMVSPARSEWRRSFVGPGGLIPMGARVEATGEVMCLVEIPAIYDHVARRVLVRPATQTVVPDLPVTKEVERQVLDRSAQVIDHIIPAVYRSQRSRRLVTAERIEYYDVPGVVRTETKQRLIDPGREDWRLIDCPVDDYHPAPMASHAPPRRPAY